MEKVKTTLDCHCQRKDSSTNPVKEIIIIDDVPGTENVVKVGEEARLLLAS